jgi:phosphopantothenoylcysteine decarboxylase/phosphopantothenate--cysteine ligase
MNILISVTGSIAIYKTLELIRLFVKNGDNVRVIMTNSAKKFITPLTFETLTRNKILDETTEDWSSDFNHIDIGKWADIFIIAPATANTVNKINAGIADNLLLQTYLAFTKEVLIAPSANTNMYMHPTTQTSLKNLQKDLTIIEADSGLLACGDTGIGKMADVNDIFYKSMRILNKKEFWCNKNVIVTAGGTIEKIDDVRFISNFSSGKMGEALALELYISGANVTLLSSKTHNLPKEINIIAFESMKDLKTKLDELTPKNDYLFMAAAVSDYSPIYSKGKIKKDKLNSNTWKLEMTKNIDILASINGIKKIGFKAEIDEKNALNSAKKALISKNANAICLNLLTKNNFGSDENEVIFITKDNETKIPQANKREIAKKIIELSQNV